MSFTTLFFVAVLPTYLLALPTANIYVSGRDHALIKNSTSGPSNSSSWSTDSLVTNSVPLSLGAFNPIDVKASAKPSFSKAPDGSESLQIHFDKGDSFEYS